MALLRSTVFTAGMLLGAAASAAAQVVALPAAAQTPVIWTSVSGALANLQSFHGGEDGAHWQWGDGVQVRATVERSLRRDMAVGLAGSYARLPLATRGGTCDGCRGDGTVWQAMGVLRLGGGGNVGFHSAFEASAGVTGFANLTRGAGDGSMPGTFAEPAKRIAPSLAAAYGIGYTLLPGVDLSLVQEIGILFYGRPAAAPSGASSIARFNTTRLGLRYAIGRQ